MQNYNISSLQSITAQDKALSNSKPSKSILNWQTTTAAASLAAMTYGIDKFDKKYTMNTEQKSIHANKALEKLTKITERINTYKTNIKGQLASILGDYKNNFTTNKPIAKVIRTPLHFVKKQGKKILSWALNLSKSSKWFAGIVGTALIIKHIKTSGKIEGKHEALNTVAKTDNLLRLSV